MKKIYALVLLIAGPLFVFGQAPRVAIADLNDGTISGVIIDSTSSKPVEFATVALMDLTSEKPVDGSVCDDKGKFTIKNIAPGNYRVVISFIGYETKTIRVAVPEKNNTINLGTIKISDSAEILKEVTVEAQKSLIEERVDRTIYNAENDATTRGGDASDVLKRVPMLTVDMDGNVSLRGNQNIQVLINNKPSTIVAQNVADALKQIPADQIKSVEVITSPSARYDAEGSAGIINIITKKNNLEGLTLNVDTGVGLRGSNLGLNGNYRRKKMGFSLGGWGRAGYNITGDFINKTTTVGDISNPETTSYSNVQSADTENQMLFGNYTVGWDYDINEKNFIASSVRFGLRSMDRMQTNFLTEAYDGNGILANTSLSEIENRDRANSVDASMTYTHLYEKKGKELSFQGQYSRNNNDNYFINRYLIGGNGNRETDNESYNQEMTAQVDYVTPIGTNQIFEIGGKDIIRKVFSDVVGGNVRSNNLNYEQNVLSGYLSYTLNLQSGYSFKAGTRYEYTTIKAYTQDQQEAKEDVIIPSYGIVVPSINVSKKFKNGKTIKASYNRRIQRPSIRFLNPQRVFQNEFNYSEGNPSLDPEFTNNFELGYSTFVKGTSLNFTAFARNTNNAIQSLRELVPEVAQNGQDTVAIKTSFSNIGLENSYGLSAFANINIGKLMLNGGGDVYYAVLDNNSSIEQYRASNEGWVISGRIFGSYNLGKGWAAQFFGFGRGRNVQLQGFQGNFRMYNLGFRKEFNEKRGSIGFAAENFLQKSIRINSETTSPQVNQFSQNTMNNRNFKITFSYRIGKMSMDQRPTRRRSINNDDMKDGGDSGMDMGGGAPAGGPPRTGGMAPGGQGRPASATPNPKAAKADSTAVVNADGTWVYTVESPQGGAGNIVLKKENGAYTGTISNTRFNKENALSSVSLTGNELSFSYDVNMGGNTMTINVKGTITGNDFNGTMAIGQFGSYPINAKKQ